MKPFYRARSGPFASSTGRQLAGLPKIIAAWAVGSVFVLFGLAIVVGYEIYWARVVKPEREGMSSALSIKSEPVDRANDGKLVHLTGALAGVARLRDPDFGVAVDALKLRRQVWMRQWQQKQTQNRSSLQVEDTRTHQGLSVGSATSFTYEQVWSEQLIDSRSFHNPGHDNPVAMGLNSRAVSAEKIALGGFTLSSNLVRQLDNFQTISLSDTNLSALSGPLRARGRPAGDETFFGADPQTPAIGDLKVKIGFAPPTTVSVIARQSGTELVPCSVGKFGAVDVLKVGTFSVVEMTTQFAKHNTQVRKAVWSLGGFAMLGGVAFTWLGLRR